MSPNTKRSLGTVIVVVVLVLVIVVEDDAEVDVVADDVEVEVVVVVKAAGTIVAGAWQGSRRSPVRSSTESWSRVPLGPEVNAIAAVRGAPGTRPL